MNCSILENKWLPNLHRDIEAKCKPAQNRAMLLKHTEKKELLLSDLCEEHFEEILLTSRNIITGTTTRRNRDSSVSTAVTGHGQRGRISSTTRSWEFFSSPPRPNRLWGPTSILSHAYREKLYLHLFIRLHGVVFKYRIRFYGVILS